ncbi:MAG: SHOCT domain-containing protein [Spirochaetaceae bacterium]|nr:SHOCT domain-containing protein [Spirochaetaceae bacterium]
MKRKILGMLFCLMAFAVYAKAPAFDGGTVIPVEKIGNIVLLNYSGLNEINIEFSVCEDSDWESIGSITTCPFAKEVKLSTKVNFSKVHYVGYKCNLPSDKKIFVYVDGRTLMFYVLEASNTALKKSAPFSDIKEDTANGFYKFDTTVQRKHYEKDVRVKNAPKCIILFQMPKTGLWEVYGIVNEGKLKVVTSYHKDIDRCQPYWIISVCEEHKSFQITAYTKHNDLCFDFSGQYETDESDNSEDDLPEAEIEVSDTEPAESTDDVEAQLLKLKQLYDNGLIDEDEYKEKKSKVLGL